MINFIRKHWMKFVFASATFFWVGCSDDSSSVSTQNNDAIDSSSSSSANTSSSFGFSSSSSADTSSAFDSSSSNYDPDDWIPPMSSTAYGIQPTYNNSSSSAPKMSSSSSYDDNKIPPMSSTAYGVEPCYSTTIQNDAGVTFDIFECRNGKKYLQNGYDESIKDELPKGVETTPLVQNGRLAFNCTTKNTCTDTPNAEGTNTDECTTTLECPPKE